jgi:hypothetical protein
MKIPRELFCQNDVIHAEEGSFFLWNAGGVKNPGLCKKNEVRE